MPVISVVGKSGTGKSTSYCPIPEYNIKGLDPKETFVINVTQLKALPFKGWKKVYKDVREDKEKGNYLASSDAKLIANTVNYISEYRKDIKNLVIDDGQYIMAFEFMGRAKEKNYDKFTDIGVNIYNIVKASSNTRPDLNIILLWHPELDRNGEFKMKTVGKMVDDYLTLEGLFTFVLYSKVSRTNDNKIKYEFVTNNDGEYPAKTPVGMFDSLYIPNDLGYVLDKIKEYEEG